MPYKNPEEAKARNKKYYQEHKEEIKQKSLEYYYSNKQKVLDRIKVYYINNRDERLKYMKEWSKENKKDSDRRYLNSEKGKIAHRRATSKRKRNLKFIELLTNPFPEEIEVDYHHINNILTIPIPRVVHRTTYGKNHKNLCIDIINMIYGEDFYEVITSENL